MKKAIGSLLVSSIILSFAAGCKKGDTGPAGTANVYYSEWFRPETYIKDTLFGVWGFKYNKSAPAITQNILDSGVVLTFGKLLGYNPSIWPANNVAQLPITVTYIQGGNQLDTWQANASPGNLRIRFTNDHNIYTSIANTHQFRYVIVPGGLSATNLSALPYREIAKIYNLPD